MFFFFFYFLFSHSNRHSVGWYKSVHLSSRKCQCIMQGFHSARKEKRCKHELAGLFSCMWCMYDGLFLLQGLQKDRPVPLLCPTWSRRSERWRLNNLTPSGANMQKRWAKNLVTCAKKGFAICQPSEPGGHEAAETLTSQGDGPRMEVDSGHSHTVLLGLFHNK